MWHLLEKISEQVTKYSTWLGQLWYICVFVFRLIVVVTIGGAVYGDEQSAFKCSTQEIGCTNMCFNVFSKISHIRFWAFQLLAVATPTVFFHFYSMSVTGQIEKLKKAEEALKLEEGDLEPIDNPKMEKDFKKMSRRKKSIGNVKLKKVYSGGDLKEIPYTMKIHYAYYLSVIVRLALEAVFIYLAYGLFHFMDPTYAEDMAVLDFLWFKVPAMFKCVGPHPEVMAACNQHLGHGVGHVPCWVSRPWEKTIFIRYMNVLSAICFLLSAVELVYLTLKGILGKRRHHRPRFFSQRPHPRQDSVFYATAPNGHHMREHENFYPTLAVPVRLSSSEIPRKYHQAHHGKESENK
ncbi:gap junction beta-2 protein-like isoform X2 [Styela clava]|uniref:gap junction alpha-4 protein-like isoform X2 n=1 Tax=Styela clava TaxID=7725 RepID=UPI00193946C9|nr:gap junction alpha-4 protein-like isoform X2 [Styela clava]